MPHRAPERRLVIVVRADPVICGHSGEARHLAEAALLRGFDDVRIVTWPIEALGALPLKPLESVLPYSPGIVVERPEPVGDYKIPDGRYTAGMVGRLVELFSEGVPTVCISLYLSPHASVVMEALAVCRAAGRDVAVRTVAEAVGSDVTNVVRSCVEGGNLGAAAHVFTSFLGHDVCVAVSEFTKERIVAAAEEVDVRWGTTFAAQCRERVAISYPAVDAFGAAPQPDELAAVLERRGLQPEGYVLFLSRVTAEKGVDDLIDGYVRSAARHRVRLVVAGTGAALEDCRRHAATTGLGDRIVFLDDVDDAEKHALMAGCAAYVLASKPRPEFVETFGIALVEKMLAGGGPVITTATGGIPEAVGDSATVVPTCSPDAIAAALDHVVLELGPDERRRNAESARRHAERFHRTRIFDALIQRVLQPA